jgi:thioredoxin reductase
MMRDTYEVVVVGGGPAGLSGALTLARARRSVLVIDAGEPRNAPAGHVHNFLTRDGMPPAELLAAGRAEVARYGGAFVSGRVVDVTRAEDGSFVVALADGSTVAAARLLVATGLVDELPPVPGLAERFGRDVLHCPYCHGHEVADEAIGVLASGPMAAHHALLWRQWSKDVTLFPHTFTGLSDEEREQLAARDIAIVEGEVTGLEVSGDRLTGVRLAGGRVVACAALAVATVASARAGFLGGLGLSAADVSMGGAVLGRAVTGDAAGATEVPGVWVAGNVSRITDQVVAAAAAGVMAGAQINFDLIGAETRAAVAEVNAQARAG